MTSFFSSKNRERIEREVRDRVNGESLPWSSPRGVGDAIQELLTAGFGEILGALASKYSEKFARRAMADLAFEDAQSTYHVVDVKTHFAEGKFSMPNLVSVERLAKLYQDDANSFDVLLVDYRVDERRVVADRVTFVPVEWLAWSCLTLGALGWGQLQIANAKNVVVEERPRRDWMLQMCAELLDFYPREIGKIQGRITHFEKVRDFWLAKGGTGG